MGSYENIVKIEEMRRKAEEGDYSSAQKILDTMELKKVKNTADLSLMAEICSENEHFEEAMELLLKIYQKAKTRKTVYQLVEVSIKRKNIEDAEIYLAEYEKIAPQDFYLYVSRFKIDKLKGEPYEKLIDILKTLKKKEYIEQWAYELAKLYYKAGLEEECIQECSDIILWFGEGTYVEKAKMLRAYYSGETDKDEMMEELKRRATEEMKEYIDTKSDEDKEFIAAGVEVESIYANAEDGEKNEYSNVEEDKYNYISSETESKYDYISNEIEDKFDYISTETEDQQEDAIAETEEDKDYFAEAKFLVEEDASDFAGDLKRDIEGILTEDIKNENFYIPQPEMSDKDRAEIEVEEILYQLLDEVDLDEEDRKIKQLDKELGLKLEEIFGNFIHVKAVKKQLVKSLEVILDEHTKSIQMIITGTAKSGKTTLAKDFSLFLNNSGKLKSTKVAKIRADKLNSIDILQKKETLKNCCLVVENASELKRDTIDKILELIQYFHGDIAVIFEENKKNMNKLFRECPKLMDLFKNRIHLPQYTIEDLCGFALSCLKQQEYQINPKAQAILKNKVYQIAKQTELNKQLEAIEELVKSAMDAADVRTGKLLPSLAAQGRLKDVEIMTVLPEDFIATL